MTYSYELQTLYDGMDIVILIRMRRLKWIGHINPKDNNRTVEHMFSKQPEGVRRRGRQSSKWWSVFGQILRREELRIGEKYVGIGKNGRRPSKRRRSTWDFRSTKNNKQYGSIVNM